MGWDSYIVAYDAKDGDPKCIDKGENIVCCVYKDFYTREWMEYLYKKKNPLLKYTSFYGRIVKLGIADILEFRDTLLTRFSLEDETEPGTFIPDNDIMDSDLIEMLDYCCCAIKLIRRDNKSIFYICE